jgi:hypothetical protein
MTCLLCTSLAVADCLCVPCGARLWAAKLWEKDPAIAAQLADKRLDGAPTVALAMVTEERVRAIQAMRSEGARRGLFAALESCRLQRQIHESAKAERAAKDGYAQ